MAKRRPLEYSAANSSYPSARQQPDVIDLTASDDDENTAARPNKARRLEEYHTQAARRTYNLPANYKGSSREDWVYANHDEEANAQEVIESESSAPATGAMELYGSLKTKIVGIRYYSGCATVGEFVLLRREPSNPYDRNAIRVDNVSLHQIGHIPRQVAAKLAPYMDEGALWLEARLSGELREFDCPLEVYMYGSTDANQQTHLRWKLKQDRLPLDAIDRREKQAAKEEKARKAAELKKAARQGASIGSSNRQWANGLQNQWMSSSGEGSSTGTEHEELADIVQLSERFNPREMGEVIEKYGVNETSLQQLPLATQPQRLITSLLPYQRQGLAWMSDKENPKLPVLGSDEVVQLWKRVNERKFTNIATNFSIINQEPTIARGGILADDMGLGKTLQVISLIIADVKDDHGRESSSKCHATLIVAPLSVMSNWRSQIEQHVQQEHMPNILIYHGPNRGSVTLKDFNRFDVVITTYGMLASEFRQDVGSRRPKHGLFAPTWHRVVLDEGHTIRNPATKSALAACNLKAERKWVLTGTPIINTLKDLFSQVKFIGLTGGLQQFEVFNSVLIRGIKNGAADATLLLQALMSTLCLRRRKDMAFIDLKLPELTEYIHRIHFTKEESKKYDALSKEAKGLLQTFENRHHKGDGRKAQDTYRHLLEVLLRLRQVCNHWKLCEERVTSLMSTLEEQQTVALTPENMKALQDLLQLAIESREECPVCMDDLTGHDPVITNCAHIFGRDCIARVIETQHKCPMCRAELRDDSVLVSPAVGLGEDNSELQDLGGEDGSSKVKALLATLKLSHKEPGTKVVVFSQWCRFLDLIQPHLDAAGYIYARLDGTMNARSRDDALEALATNPRTTILLASLGVCSVGLNLTAANTVVLCDTWWAPAIEDQAVDRVHRLGQTRPCTVWRLVMDGSIEERTLEIQADKRKLMAKAFQEKEGQRKGRAGRLGDIQRLLA